MKPRRGVRPPSLEYQYSAGGLVVRSGQILLILTGGGNRWQIPKGHVEPGESPAEAAEREVREETGVHARVVATLPSIQYSFASRSNRKISKHVDYYLLEYLSGSEQDFDPTEVDAARWVSWDEGLSLLSHANERKVVLVARALVLGPELCKEPPP